MGFRGEAGIGGRRSRRGIAVAGVAVGLVLLVAAALAGCSSGNTDEAQPTPTASQPSERPPATYASVDDMLSQDPFYIAHRGGSAQWPEMSMLAYSNAASWGMGALEVSVARTKDGVYFGLHDKTLDRTSKVTGDVDPATLTWDELTAQYKNKLNAPTSEGVPYAPVSEIFEAYAQDHVIFVDPKYIGDSAELAELIEEMLAAAAADHWVLKGYNDNVSLAKLGRDEGIASWGYYYSRNISELDTTSENWNMLGLEIDASAEQFATLKALGKPVIAFFITDEQTLAEATRKGAQGMMVSDVPTTLGSPLLAGS
ncbi:MAG: hypothetical protein HQ526_00145 [Actinobacteria bacterium]|nr:hypothetical protein [Actinomycetota bacterium]